MSVAVAANPVNWFELPVVDMERAKKFYAAVFGSVFTDVQLSEGQMAWFPMERGVPGRPRQPHRGQAREAGHLHARV